MLKIHLSRLMGEKRLKISEVSRLTGVDRGTITRLYQETAVRVELDTLEQLCRVLECGVGDLLEYLPEPDTRSNPRPEPSA